ncbi:MAG: Gfo/Idh/MocA family oxidoreductase [Verrucomicrobia bacterium]|nr:Gfo/Idh/MocA family oxidoreductase [Verrucomicrobiota bacterium]
MDNIRLGIIGMGNIGKFHADYLLAGKVNRCTLAAVCSPSPDKLESCRQKGVSIFSDGEKLIWSRTVDAVIIATPHFQHATLGIAALGAGLHVMVEKPVSAHKADAERLLAAHDKNRRLVFGGMFQLRVEPRYEKIRQLIQSGDLGRLVRVNWINTDWFRTEAYYTSSAWRATWKGEGGGVLLNQCLHNLDVFQWLCGMPARVRGFCQFGRFHSIEVEDSVTAYLEWADGATGTFISSSGEAPGTNRFEIVGTRGTLVLENGKLVFTRNLADMTEFSRSAKQGFVKPEARVEDIPFANAVAPHAVLMQNFVDAILDGGPLIAPGADGLNSVELANAMMYSSLLGQTLELPMDGAAWEQKLNELIAGSTLQKQVVHVVTDDFAGSFRK